MRQIFKVYTDWEDYKNGMYSLTNPIDAEFKIKKSEELLKDPNKFYEVCLLILNNWKVSSDVNLTNKHQNRRAWLGAAACCYNHNCNETLTRVAWSKLTKNEQDIANRIADKIINKYERENFGIHSNLGEKMLF